MRIPQMTWAALMLSASSLTAQAASVFINEFHYDNASTDIGEFIEIAGPAGTDLDGWSLVLYNGNGGGVYNTLNLSDTLTDVGAGFGFHVQNLPTNGLQNGAPDGMALVDNNGVVQQFLSYEGSFTASGGPADGLSSEDIGLAETSSTPVGESLQLTGTGSDSADFVWFGPITQTPNAVNNGQSFGAVAETAPTVVATSPAAGDTDVAANAVIEITFSEAVIVTAGGWFDIDCDLSGNHGAADATADDVLFTLTPNNAFDAGDHCVVTVYGDQVVDLDQNDPPDSMSSDVVFAFDVAVPAGGGGVVINEIHADPASDISGDANGDGLRDTTQDEFVEIYNDSGADLDISGWTLSDGNGLRHSFPAGSLLQDQCAVVVFGGGNPSGSFGDALVQTASSGALGLNNGGDSITLNDGFGGQVSVSYGSEGGNNQSLTRNPDVSGDFAQHAGIAAAAGSLFSPGSGLDGTAFVGCDGDDNGGDPVAELVPIYQVQGSSDSSALVGQTVIVEGIVTGDFQDGSGSHGDLNGFFIQEEAGDGDPATSDGIFVFDGSAPAVDVAVGDKLRVTGQVDEYFGLTEITNVTEVSIIGSGNIAPTSVSLPTATALINGDGDWIPDLEPYEGMLVRFADTLSVTELFQLDRYGEMRLSQGGRLFQYTNGNAPDVAGYSAHLEAIARRSIVLDDGLTIQNPDPIRYPAPGLDAANTLRMGDTVSDLTGVLHFSFDLYRVMPTVEPQFVALNSRPTGSPLPEAPFKVASVNVLNLFNDLDDGGGQCFPSFSSGDCRGADSQQEFDRQLEKLVSNLIAIDADIYGLVELENDIVDGADSTIATLVDAINLAGGSTTCGPNFAWVDTVGRAGGDAIATGIIYCDQVVKLADGSSVEILDDTDQAVIEQGFGVSVFNGPNTNRSPVAASFEDLDSGEVFTLVVTHMKSKGGNGSGDDADIGDGQGNWNATRTRGAAALAAWLADDPTGSGDPDFLVLGDFNAYPEEDPVKYMENNGFENLTRAFAGQDAPYSFVFDGQAGALDFAFATPDLAAKASGAMEWHVNADEPDGLDYNLDFDRNAGMFDGSDPYRASDHDPMIVAFSFIPSAPVEPGDLDGDADVDRNDLVAMRAYFNQPADGADDPADINGDGVINVLDFRAMVRLCTRPRCATE